MGGRGARPRCRYGHAAARPGGRRVQMFLEFPSRIRSGEQDATQGGACQGFEMMRGSCSALPTDGCGALRCAGSGRTWRAPPRGAAHPCYPCPLVFLGLLLFFVLFQENQLLPRMLNHPAKQVVLLQGASLIFPAGPKSQRGSPLGRRGMRSRACAFPTGAVGKLPVTHLSPPAGAPEGMLWLGIIPARVGPGPK